MKKQILALSLLILITLGLTVGAVYQYQHHQNVTDSAVRKAQKQRDTALAAAEAYKLNTTAANTQAQAYATQKVTLCADIAKAKIVEPLCTTPKE